MFAIKKTFYWHSGHGLVQCTYYLHQILILKFGGKFLTQFIKNTFY